MIIVRPSTLRGIVETTGWMFGRRRRVRIVGASMQPTLSEGDFVLVDPSRVPADGELALAEHPERGGLLIVKRVASRCDDGSFVVSSDNPGSGTDSRTWGPLQAEKILGTVTIVLGDGYRSLEAPSK